MQRIVCKMYFHNHFVLNIFMTLKCNIFHINKAFLKLFFLENKIVLIHTKLQIIMYCTIWFN